MATLADPAPDQSYRVPRGFFTSGLSENDPAVEDAIHAELRREQTQIELIASENIVSKAVLEAQGSVLTNKYAEGYPGRRYYQGCAPSDAVETLAIERAKKLFGCGFANVQPHSGAQANGAVMMALLKPGDSIMGMSLAAGGHLTHGAPPAQSGKWFNAVQYGVREDDHLVDFDEVERLAKEHRPKMIIAGGHDPWLRPGRVRRHRGHGRRGPARAQGQWDRGQWSRRRPGEQAGSRTLRALPDLPGLI
jgi:glycine hydroxymethyltransferase